MSSYELMTTIHVSPLSAPAVGDVWRLTAPVVAHTASAWMWYSEAMQGLSLLKTAVFCRFRIQQAGSFIKEDKPFLNDPKVGVGGKLYQPMNFSWTVGGHAINWIQESTSCHGARGKGEPSLTTPRWESTANGHQPMNFSQIVGHAINWIQESTSCHGARGKGQSTRRCPVVSDVWSHRRYAACLSLLGARLSNFCPGIASQMKHFTRGVSHVTFHEADPIAPWKRAS
jgi:hypothetical protein